MRKSRKFHYKMLYYNFLTLALKEFFFFFFPSTICNVISKANFVVPPLVKKKIIMQKTKSNLRLKVRKERAREKVPTPLRSKMRATSFDGAGFPGNHKRDSRPYFSLQFSCGKENITVNKLVLCFHNVVIHTTGHSLQSNIFF